METEGEKNILGEDDERQESPDHRETEMRDARKPGAPKADEHAPTHGAADEQATKAPGSF